MHEVSWKLKLIQSAPQEISARALFSGERIRLGCWFRRLAETNFDFNYPPSPRLPSALSVDEAMARESLQYCDDGHLEILETATQGVQHEQPARVNNLLSQFFA